MSSTSIRTESLGTAPLYKQAQEWLRPALSVKNAIAIDATCGNGHDTLFFCRTLGTDRGVFGIDLQKRAVESTRGRLETEGFSPILTQMDHALLGEFLDEHSIREVHAAVFNLGYLPGGDHHLITRPDSTLPAIQAILERRAAPFRLAVVAYRGHPGGAEEARQVEQILLKIDPKQFLSQALESANRESGPVLYAVANRKSDIHHDQ